MKTLFSTLFPKLRFGKLILITLFTYLTISLFVSCGSDNVTNNPTNPGTSNSVTLLYPSNDTTVQNYSGITFSYSATNSPLSYRIQIDTNSNFTAPLWNIVTGDTAKNIGAPINQPHYYYWRVIAKYSSDSVVSSFRKFYWMN